MSNLQRAALFRRVKGFSDCLIRCKNIFFLFYFRCSFIKSSVKKKCQLHLSKLCLLSVCLINYYSSIFITTDKYPVTQNSSHDKTSLHKHISQHLSVYFFFSFSKTCSFPGCAPSEFGSTCHCLSCFCDNNSWKCVLPYAYTDCLSVCQLWENTDPGAAGELMTCVYTDIYTATVFPAFTQVLI